MRTRYAPIAYFAFNRPAHAARSLAALAANPEAAETDLHIFIDGPRNDGDAKLVAEVERIARSTRGFCNIEIIASPGNKGLYAAITNGVGRVVADAGRVIVVEDDIVVSPFFLRYMNDGLDRYAADERVGSIHAYAPPIPGLPDYYFLRGGDCWGWATWADRWSLFRSDPVALLGEIVHKGQLSTFAKTYGVPGLKNLIRRRLGKNQSWAALWNASLFLEFRVTLHPGCSLVTNIGNDGSGTHSHASTDFDTRLSGLAPNLPHLVPIHDPVSAGMVRAFYEGTTRPPLPAMAQTIYRIALTTQARALAFFGPPRGSTATDLQNPHQEHGNR